MPTVRRTSKIGPDCVLEESGRFVSPLENDMTLLDVYELKTCIRNCIYVTMGQDSTLSSLL